ncbi:MAG: hypothetical protein AAGI07_19780 [Bacteroidota bacterium]
MLKLLFIYFTGLFFLSACGATQKKANEATLDRINSAISVSIETPNYWAYKGKNVMLLGGSNEDNAFQMPGIITHLDELKATGGNYIRCTMSSRDSGNVWPFYKNEEGLYDLKKWNDEYWLRFDRFLKACHDREIIVQIEIWATFDFYRDYWNVNPFNPKNNITYSVARSKLPETVVSHPTWTENNFFRTVPQQESNLVVLGYQQKFVDKLLSYSLQYDNILYCMDNETSVTADWGKFWSLYIKKVAKEQGKVIFTTEMWDPHDLAHVAHRETIDHPEVYDFADISQNNHNAGDVHWINGLKQLQRIEASGIIRPANNVKIYGNDGGRHQTTKNAIESFCRNVLIGCASARFHRPTSGQGLNQVASSVIKSMRMVTEMPAFFEGLADNELLLDREENEAYCRRVGSNSFIVYFTNGGEVALSISKIDNVKIQWIEVLKSVKQKQVNEVVKGGKLKLSCPEKGDWVALVNFS